jgi:EpsI family protein
MAFFVMVASPIAASSLRPHASWYEQLGRPDYQTVIPTQFGDWVDAGDIENVLVTPEQADIIKTIYTQTLSRLYVHRLSGRRIMVSVAHGLDQTYPHQMHWPEVCYPAQGFQIESTSNDQIAIGTRHLSVARMTVVRNGVREQVTYWMRTGDQVTRGSLGLNVARIRLGIRGYKADGLLFVLSEISSDSSSSDELESRFIFDLLTSVNHREQAALIGRQLP